MSIGIKTITEYLKNIPNSAGIYQMIDKNDKIIYIGKARNLHNRVEQYTQIGNLSTRIINMVSLVNKIEFITTKTDADAILLEANLIKLHQPRYNILLKDDKSFPFILIREDHEFPQILKYRGKKTIKGKYFGPFISSKDVGEMIDLIKKSFLLRSCSDNEFKSRTKPCIEYQIKRCSAPCVNKVSKEEYQKLVSDSHKFLSGKNEEIVEMLHNQMNEASKNFEYEKATIYRDRIKSINKIFAKQQINLSGNDDIDIFAIVEMDGKFAIWIMFIRGGINYGGNAYFPKHTEDSKSDDVLFYSIMQFYQNNTPVSNILINCELEDDIKNNLQDALKIAFGFNINIETRSRGNKFDLLKVAEDNARQSLITKMNSKDSNFTILKQLADYLKISKQINRIEIYDNSHIAGKYRVGGMVVFTSNGFDKNLYRRFTIKNTDINIKLEDDYAMLEEVLTRRFTRLLNEYPVFEEEIWPDLVIIDGGKGHISRAKEVLTKLGLNKKIIYMSIAKGEKRNAGNETFFIYDDENTKSPLEFKITNNKELLFFLQRLRDEAHRFAITSHRIKRSKSVTKSVLDQIADIGDVRKKALLSYFLSIDAIKNASIDDLMKVKNINKKTAEQIYKFFQNNK